MRKGEGGGPPHNHSTTTTGRKSKGSLGHGITRNPRTPKRRGPRPLCSALHDVKDTVGQEDEELEAEASSEREGASTSNKRGAGSPEVCDSEGACKADQWSCTSASIAESDPLVPFRQPEWLRHRPRGFPPRSRWQSRAAWLQPPSRSANSGALCPCFFAGEAGSEIFADHWRQQHQPCTSKSNWCAHQWANCCPDPPSVIPPQGCAPCPFGGTSSAVTVSLEGTPAPRIHNRAMRQRILGSHTPPCHRRMVITTLSSMFCLAALQRKSVHSPLQVAIESS